MPYTENFVVLAKRHAGGNGNLIINFAWPYIEHRYSTLPESRVSYPVSMHRARATAIINH